MIKEILINLAVLLTLAVLFAGGFHKQAKCHGEHENTHTSAAP